ncbi:OR1F1 protein, partial [Crocuta crocuta]
MGKSNQSVTSDFTLMGLFSHSGPHLVLFSLVVVIFTIGLLGNVILLFLIRTDSRLHTPMYFLLSQLSLLDVGFPLVTIPKMAANFLQGEGSISFGGCAAQMCFLMLMGVSEGVLLSLMSYDRYVAVCHPLHYPVLMRRQVCLLMVGTSWLSGVLVASIQTSIALHFPYWANLTGVSEFLLLGLSENPKQQQVLFILFLSMYLVTGLGNLLIILAIAADTRLHTPMYFFLANLAFVDICFTSTTIPKMLANHMSGHRGIPYAGCLTQMFFFIWFAGIDSFLLTAMAYDRYAAICHPLHYATSVTPRLCGLLVAASWTGAFGNALTHTVLLTRLSFCTHNRVPHFFCDLSPLLKLACSDTFLNNVMVYTVGALPIITPFVGILVSYTRIFAAVLRIPSTRGKRKAFSTCGSHLS